VAPTAPVVASAAPSSTAPTPAKARNGKPQAQEAQPLTSIAAKIDVGWGNILYVRGQGDGLSWEHGTPLHCVDGSTWLWATATAKDKVVFKLLINDQVWAQGEDLTVEAGKRIEVEPVF